MSNYDINFLQLIENNNDSYQDLRIKNKKLRDIIIKITEQLKILNTKYQELEKQFASEKKILLDKLEQITGNYKLYAEGYQEKIILKKDMGTLINNYKQNNKVMNSFRDSFLFLLKKNISLFNDFKKFENNSYNNKNIEFITKVRNNLFNNIVRFRKSIDMINFPEFYKEYLTFIENEEKEENEINKIYNRKINKNDIKKGNNNKYRKKSFTNNENKYSFTKINIDTNRENYYTEKTDDNCIIKNNVKYKDTNYFKDYLRQNQIYKNNRDIESHKVNYLKYGKFNK
jgi:hypothetical protein